MARLPAELQLAPPAWRLVARLPLLPNLLLPSLLLPSLLVPNLLLPSLLVLGRSVPRGQPMTVLRLPRRSLPRRSLPGRLLPNLLLPLRRFVRSRPIERAGLLAC